MTTKPEYRDGNGFIAEVIRSPRKRTADIRVEDGAVSVVVPTELSIERIDSLLKTKRKWIKEKIALQQDKAPASSRQFVSGEAYPYLGRNYRLKVVKGNFTPVRLIHGRLLVSTPEGSQQPHMIRNALVRWYKRQAMLKLTEKISRYIGRVGAKPKSIGVKSFKSRWGSCTQEGHIDFNWQIMMAPNRMVDYVVVHELCHLLRHDHSPEYWKEVERIIPDYQQCRNWLREHAHDIRL